MSIPTFKRLLMDIKRTALLLMDMQNDFLHANGAYGRADIRIDNKRSMIEQLLKVTDLLREKGGLIISTNFTLIANKESKPIISEKLKTERPFLTRGDFQQGRWGHQLIDELAPADYIINKIADSAFYMTYLEWLLQKLNIEHIYFAGMWSNGDHNPTIRDAQVRGFKVVTLRDACATFTNEPCNLDELETQTCVEFQQILKQLV